MTEFVYVLAGVLVGIALTELIHWLVPLWTRYKAKKKVEKPKVVVDKDTQIRCSACQSHITTAPIMRTVGDKGDVLVFRCQQCGTFAGVPVPL